MKINRKIIFNILFVILIGLLIYPPTKIYFIRLISFSPSVKNDVNQKKIKNFNWQLKGLNTKDIDFSDLKGKVIFVNLWATWCPPCVAEMPSIQSLYDAYKEKVVFLFVTNEDWKTVEKFYEKRKFKLPTYNALSKNPKELFSKSIPATFIISKEGKIVVDKRGAADWNSAKTRTILDNLLEE